MALERKTLFRRSGLWSILDFLMASCGRGHSHEPLKAKTDRTGIRFWPSEALEQDGASGLNSMGESEARHG